MTNERSEKGLRLKDFIEIRDNLLKNIEIKSVLDIGGGSGDFGDALKPKKYVNVNAPYMDERQAKNTQGGVKVNPDITLDLNKIRKLPFKNKSFDLVIASQVIEHLPDLEKIANEMKRVSKKFILIGLPNELEWSKRILFLFGKNMRGIGHRYCFDPDVTRKKFIEPYLRGWTVVGEYHMTKGYTYNVLRLLPFKTRKFLANKFPKLCSTENYYLLEREQHSQKAL